jgi:microcystin-dependent protein
MEVFIGTIMPVGFNFAPRGWAFCNGQLLSISQYSALFSLLGTTYGGNGQTTFGLPDLRGRGNGQTSFTLSVNNLPAHTHTATTNLQASTGTTGPSTSATAGAVIGSRRARVDARASGRRWHRAGHLRGPSQPAGRRGLTPEPALSGRVHIVLRLNFSSPIAT